MRLFPYRNIAAGIRQLNEVERQSACMYSHPWELDSELPRLASGLVSRLRTYSGLSPVGPKIERLMTEFRFSSLTDVFPLYDGQLGMPAEACAWNPPPNVPGPGLCR